VLLLPGPPRRTADSPAAAPSCVVADTSCPPPPRPLPPRLPQPWQRPGTFLRRAATRTTSRTFWWAAAIASAAAASAAAASAAAASAAAASAAAASAAAITLRSATKTRPARQPSMDAAPPCCLLRVASSPRMCLPCLMHVAARSGRWRAAGRQRPRSWPAAWAVVTLRMWRCRLRRRVSGSYCSGAPPSTLTHMPSAVSLSWWVVAISLVTLQLPGHAAPHAQAELRG